MGVVGRIRKFVDHGEPVWVAARGLVGHQDIGTLACECGEFVREDRRAMLQRKAPAPTILARG